MKSLVEQLRELAARIESSSKRIEVPPWVETVGGSDGIPHVVVTSGGLRNLAGAIEDATTKAVDGLSRAHKEQIEETCASLSRSLGYDNENLHESLESVERQLAEQKIRNSELRIALGIVSGKG